VLAVVIVIIYKLLLRLPLCRQAVTVELKRQLKREKKSLQVDTSGHYLNWIERVYAAKLFNCLFNADLSVNSDLAWVV
jgi:hypothetical protein